MSPAKGCQFALDPDKVGTVHVIPAPGWACGRCGWAVPRFGWTILTNKETSDFELCEGRSSVVTERVATGSSGRYD